MGKRLSPRLESLVVFAVVLVAAAFAAFVKSKVNGTAFSLNWGVALVAAAGCAAVSYLGPALWHHFVADRRKSGSN